MRMVIHTEAKAEVRKSRRWYDERQEGLGLELLDEIRAALTRIQNDPRVGLRYGDSRYRFYKPKRFPFVIYYLELDDYVCVLAIAHERRKQGYWLRRRPQ